MVLGIRKYGLVVAESYFQCLDLMFVETSAKNGENVEDAFVKVARTILQKIETGIPPKVFYRCLCVVICAVSRGHKS
jgi:hypothetical protein